MEIFFLILGVFFIFAIHPFEATKNEWNDKFLFFLCEILLFVYIIVLCPFLIYELNLGKSSDQNHLEVNSLYQVLGQPHCWQENGKNKCLAILQKSDGQTKMYLVNKKAEDIPKMFIWRNNNKMERLPK